jgi:hypothetical protein
VVNPIDVKIIVNIPADEPLIHPMMIESVAWLSQRKTVLATFSDCCVWFYTCILFTDNTDGIGGVVWRCLYYRY